MQIWVKVLLPLLLTGTGVVVALELTKNVSKETEKPKPETTKPTNPTPPP